MANTDFEKVKKVKNQNKRNEKLNFFLINKSVVN